MWGKKKKKTYLQNEVAFTLSQSERFAFVGTSPIAYLKIENQNKFH